MSAVTVWWVLAGVAAGAELLTGSFFLLMVALGMVAGALAAHADWSLAAQMISAATVGGGAVAAWAQWRRRQPRVSSHANPAVLLDIGSTVSVEQWLPDGTTQVKHRGALWSARPSQTGAAMAAGAHRIVGVQGNVLLLDRVTDQPAS